ncbi:avt3 [Symbiodinium pilosum]|uniref:Avt3 protein n=1 Tax=Symbiodinium pilosum TaxID=2952 RepID=A0A812TWK8_SYMPI|nr:avt3 [Symbiodinium pilosum]
MAEDEVVRDYKRSLSRNGAQQAQAFSQNSDLEVSRQRSSSLPELPVQPLFPELGRASDIAQPGGFRREHVLRQAPNAAAERPLLDSMLDPRLQHYFSKTFESQVGSSSASTASVGASNLSTVLVILKSTVGGTLIIIPGAFARTGLLVAPLELLFIGGIEIYCMVLLVRCVRTLGGGTYGDIARMAMGPVGSWAVDMSILLSQTGFVCSEMLYVAKNCNGALQALGLMSPLWSEQSILLLQLFVVIPMSWIRQLKYFQVSNLIANTTVASSEVLDSASASYRFCRRGCRQKAEQTKFVNSLRGKECIRAVQSHRPQKNEAWRFLIQPRLLQLDKPLSES